MGYLNMGNKLLLEYCKQGQSCIGTGYILKNKFDIKEVTTEEKTRYLKLSKIPFLNKKYKYELLVHLDNTIIEIPEIVYKKDRWYGVKCGDLDLFYVQGRNIEQEIQDKEDCCDNI